MPCSLSNNITLCALFYGDYPDLARRCLCSIAGATAPEPRFLSDIRLGLNCVTGESRAFIFAWAFQASQLYDLPVTVYSSEQTLKYPMMRRMFRTPDETSTYVMWFDDDSYLEGKEDFWDRVRTECETADLLGQPWRRRMSHAQWRWIRTQPWCNREYRDKPDNFVFSTGGWWTLRRDMVRTLDWPIPELRHCGGDAMLCEAIRHVRGRMINFSYGVRINADEAGAHSKAQRRGYSEQPIAWDWDGRKLPTDHQSFKVNWIRYRKGHTECGSTFTM